MQVRNYIRGEWCAPLSSESIELKNPATGDTLAGAPVGDSGDVAAAVAAAADAYPNWRITPPEDRIQYLFKLKQLLEDNVDEVARTTTIENGKTLAESRGELRRGIENVEVACGIPILMQGHNLENVAAGIDESLIRQALGVVAAITPFNFPAMIPLWFLPYAIACGNCFILKPSERTPLTAVKLFELIDQLGLPPGVLSLVNGGKDTVNLLLDHPDVKAISFVGSTPVARHVYARAAASGKRVQCQGGAKNHVVVMPDADPDTTPTVIGDSAFGCAGQRCLAVSVALAVGEAHTSFREAISETAAALKVGNGLEAGCQMGPVITASSRDRIEGSIELALSEGAAALVDGRSLPQRGVAGANFIGPTVLDGAATGSALAETEIFGPVLSLARVENLDEAIRVINANRYGNAASIFTTSGASARQFRTEVDAGNVGVNIGVAAPMAYFPFSGWKASFLGTVHGQGRDAVEFYTDKKVVVERWPKAWSRKF
jgi:malonate-semialdehyde dehydrogenase (acetylating)/methylmalonate-semialdehyde dehydrogenase